MIKLSKEEIDSMEYLGTGRFGKVVHDGKYAYKIYIPDLYMGCGRTTNPCLAGYGLRRRRLMKRAKLIKYSHLIDAEISVNHHFCGVRYKYSEGKALSSIYVNLPYLIKRDISLKLIRNNQELLDHCIYQLDYKLNNIVCSPNYEPFIIDLDGFLTKATLFPNNYYGNQALFGLKQTIMAMFQDDCCSCLSFNIKKLLGKYKLYEPFYDKTKTTSNEIINYLTMKDEPQQYLFITLEEVKKYRATIKKLQARKRVKLVIVVNTHDSFFEIAHSNLISNIINDGIKIYDIILVDESHSIEEYIKNSNTKGFYTTNNGFQYTKVKRQIK